MMCWYPNGIPAHHFVTKKRVFLGSGYTCKMEATYTKRWSDDRDIIAALNTFAAYCLYITQGIQDTLRKAEIFNRAGQFTMLDQKSPIACHACEECFDRMHCICVMEARHIHSPIHSPNKLFKAGIPCYHHRMERQWPPGIWRR